MNDRLFNEREHGVVLPLTALLIVLLITLLAFEVDVARVGISEAQYKRAAGVTALSALNVYLQEAMDRPGSLTRRHKDAAEVALERARMIAALPGIKPRFGAVEEKERNILAPQIRLRGDGGAVAGELRFGHWHFVEPPGGCSRKKRGKLRKPEICPCKENQWVGACFEAFEDDEPSRDIATAVQVELFTPENKPLEYVFGGVLGRHGTSIRVRATASILSDPGAMSTVRIVENVHIGRRKAGDVRERSAKKPLERNKSKLPLMLTERKSKYKPFELPPRTIEREITKCVPGKRLFQTAGEYKFLVPGGCEILEVYLWGAGGASGSFRNQYPDGDGGGGGFVSGKMSARDFRQLRIIVGSGGKNPCNPGYIGSSKYGGGGERLGKGGTGGGYSAVFSGKEVLLLAGGGGAGGVNLRGDKCEGEKHGGAGGGEEGMAGMTPTCFGRPASGGLLSKGGTGQNGDKRLNGGALLGGIGGGGGGYFGGGGARAERGGAGGGSSYISSDDAILEGTTAQGERRKPGGEKEALYIVPAGEGGVGVDSCSSSEAHGQSGLVVLVWRESSDSHRDAAE